jgi:hypothetical protein
MKLKYVEVVAVILFGVIIYFAYTIRSDRTSDCDSKGGVMIPNIGCIKKDVFITLIHEKALK